MTKPLANKTALVTGGARGIGAAIARRLAKDGANVAVTYSKSSAEAEKVVKELTAQGVKAKAYPADAAQADALLKLAKDVAKEFGQIDILVNNAGVFEAGNSIGEIDAAQVKRVFDVNVEAVFTLTNAVVPHMKPGSRVINISSVVGERSAGAGMSIYSASKFAVTGFSRGWAKDLAAKGILVNAVQPGPIATDMNPEDGEFADEMRKQIPLGRYGKPEEIAGAVAFLAGPEASYITGARLDIDGGFNA